MLSEKNNSWTLCVPMFKTDKTRHGIIVLLYSSLPARRQMPLSPYTTLVTWIISKAKAAVLQSYIYVRENKVRNVLRKRETFRKNLPTNVILFWRASIRRAWRGFSPKRPCQKRNISNFCKLSSSTNAIQFKALRSNYLFLALINSFLLTVSHTPLKWTAVCLAVQINVFAWGI